MYRKSLVIKRYKDDISRLKNRASEVLTMLGKEKDYNSYRVLLSEYNSLLSKAYIIGRKIENLQNGYHELGSSIDSLDTNSNNNDYDE